MADYIGIGINTVVDTIRGLTQLARTKDINKARLVRELKHNLLLLAHKDKDGVNDAGLIKAISNEAISKAIDDKFNFNSLRKGKIPSKLIYHDRLRKYENWTAGRMLESIDGKIAELKKLETIYTDISKAPVNLKLRLGNLYYQIKLLADFINAGK